MHQFNQELNALFATNSNADASIKMAQYMRNKFDFFGIPKPLRTELTKGEINELAEISHQELKVIVSELWQFPQRELQYSAMDIIEKYQKKFDESLIELIEKLIVEKSWWDTVDLLSGKLAGRYFKKYPHKMELITRRWNQSENMWLNRSSIIFQLSFKNNTNTELLKEYISRHSASNEFFLQKSIGWALREYSKTDAVFIENFIKSTALSPLSVREALRIIRKSGK